MFAERCIVITLWLWRRLAQFTMFFCLSGSGILHLRVDNFYFSMVYLCGYVLQIMEYLTHIC
jgi:hypothetical protein